MRKAIAPLLTLALVLVGGFAAWQGQWAEREIGTALAERDTARAANQRAARRIRVAELALRVDTIRLTRWLTIRDTLRDSLTITDTLEVLRFIAVQDSALQACVDVRRSCEMLALALRDSAAAVRDELFAERKLGRRPWTSAGLELDNRGVLGGYVERDWWRFRGGLSVTPAPGELRAGVRFGLRW